MNAVKAEGTVTMSHTKYGFTYLNVFKMTLKYGNSVANTFVGVKIWRLKLAVNWI